MRLIHLSDLHFGHHDPGAAAGLADDIASIKPDLVVVSGDFAQVGTEVEFKQARAFLDTLAAPVFAVPGNHDVPAINLLRRFFDPYSLYRKYVAAEIEPFLELGGVALAGLNTSRNFRFEWNWGHGTLDEKQLRALVGRFSKASPDAVRVIVAHHPLLYPEKIVQQEARVVDRADQALKVFGELGVRLVLSGHFHLSYVRKHEQPGTVKEGTPTGPREAAAAPILVVQASSTISTRLRGGQPNSYNIITIDNGTIAVAVREWEEGVWRTEETALAPT